MTLFLLAGFSRSVFSQQFFGKNEKKFSQAPIDKLKLSVLNSETSRARFFIVKDKLPGADALPPGRQTAGNYTRPNSNERFKKYAKRMFGPSALAGDFIAAGIAQIFDTPKEWENNSRGFGRRISSTIGRSIIKETVTYGLDESFKLDSNYYKSGSSNFKDRLKNAVLSAFTARKADGKRVFGFPRIVGTYASAIIANQYWYPSRYDYKNGISSGTISLGTSFAVNLLRELF